MIPAFLNSAATQVWEAAIEGRGITLYPWLESLLCEANTPEHEWVPSLEIGSAIYLLHGRFAEGERLARRAVARSLKEGPSGTLYLRALLALARAYHCQGRTEEAWDLWREVQVHPNPTLDPWIDLHRQLFKGVGLPGEPVPHCPSWLEDSSLLALARPDPFPLWRGHLYRCDSPLAELPLWDPVPYPTPLDELAAWPRQRGLEREPLLQFVKLWRQTHLALRWLGSVGEARFTYSIELQLECPGRSPHWVSVEVAGSGYELLEAGIGNSNLMILQDGRPIELPANPEKPWRVLFRGASGAVQRGTRAVVRVGFLEGPPAQAFVRA
ncbi:hypothetical protein IV102_21220 [bacterium]|nr:hypothetical protein [bacterium]